MMVVPDTNIPDMSADALRTTFAGWQVLDAWMKQSMSVPQSRGPDACWMGMDGVMFCSIGGRGGVGTGGVLLAGAITNT